MIVWAGAMVLSAHAGLEDPTLIEKRAGVKRSSHCHTAARMSAGRCRM